LKLENGNISSLHNSRSPIFFYKVLFPFILMLFFSSFGPEGYCAQVTLTWDPNSESDLAGYKIYSGVQSGNYSRNVDVGNVTNYTLNSLDLGMTYYVAATAYNTQGLESGFSNEVVYTVPSCTYVISPSSASFSASGGTGSVSITTQAGCNWGTSASASWVTINSGSGTGSGTMRYTVSSNTGTARSASLTVAGNVFTVGEAGISSYIVTASAGSGGSLSPSGQVSVAAGANQTFTITPNTGFRIADVIVDGVSRGAITSYAFSSVSANHTITASFTLNSSATSKPVVSTGLASSVTSSSATLNGIVNPNGLSTTYIFQWGRTTSYGYSTAVTSAGSGTGNVAASAGITGLSSNAVYHYRLVATNSVGTTYGADQSFTTTLNQTNSTTQSSQVDFNSDGKTDILWRHKQSGQIAVWYMNGITPTGSVVVADFPDMNWEIVGTGNFNSDGKTDILWRHKQSGQIAVWYMNGITPTGSVVVADFPDMNWEIVGTGNFNSDGKTDILWRHKQSGQIAVWIMNGITRTSSVVVADFPDLNWEIIGTGDFNSDGKTDILWRHKQSGQISVWIMNGITRTSSVVVADFPDLNWEIVGTGDFNSDGKTDILWRHKQSGQISVWIMNGITRTSSVVVADFPNLSWMIVAP
jgi:hypothetical protein